MEALIVKGIEDIQFPSSTPLRMVASINMFVVTAKVWEENALGNNSKACVEMTIACPTIEKETVHFDYCGSLSKDLKVYYTPSTEDNTISVYCSAFTTGTNKSDNGWVCSGEDLVSHRMRCISRQLELLSKFFPGVWHDNLSELNSFIFDIIYKCITSEDCATKGPAYIKGYTLVVVSERSADFKSEPPLIVGQYLYHNDTRKTHHLAEKEGGVWKAGKEVIFHSGFAITPKMHQLLSDIL